MNKRMTAKSDSDRMIQEFLAKGGRITKCPPQTRVPYKTNPVGDVVVVEIDAEALPPELRKFVSID